MNGLDLDSARSIIAGAQAEGHTNGMAPLTVVVLDAGGHLVAAEREDGCSIGRFDIAFGKAYGSLALGIDSRAIMARAEVQPYFVAAATAAVGGRLVPVPGGLLARDERGRVVGAVGISGDSSDNDETAARAGLAAAGMTAEGD